MGKYRCVECPYIDRCSAFTGKGETGCIAMDIDDAHDMAFGISDYPNESDD